MKAFQVPDEFVEEFVGGQKMVALEHLPVILRMEAVQLMEQVYAPRLSPDQYEAGINWIVARWGSR